MVCCWTNIRIDNRVSFFDEIFLELSQWKLGVSICIYNSHDWLLWCNVYIDLIIMRFLIVSRNHEYIPKFTDEWNMPVQDVINHWGYSDKRDKVLRFEPLDQGSVPSDTCIWDVNLGNDLTLIYPKCVTSAMAKQGTHSVWILNVLFILISANCW